MIGDSAAVASDAAGHLGNAGLLGSVRSTMASTALETGVDVRFVAVGERLRRCRRWTGVTAGEQSREAQQQGDLQPQTDW